MNLIKVDYEFSLSLWMCWNVLKLHEMGDVFELKINNPK